MRIFTEVDRLNINCDTLSTYRQCKLINNLCMSLKKRTGYSKINLKNLIFYYLSF